MSRNNGSIPRISRLVLGATIGRRRQCGPSIDSSSFLKFGNAVRIYFGVGIWSRSAKGLSITFVVKSATTGFVVSMICNDAVRCSPLTDEILESFEETLRSFYLINSSDMRIESEVDFGQCMTAIDGHRVSVHSIGETIFIQPKNIRSRMGALYRLKRFPWLDDGM